MTEKLLIGALSFNQTVYLVYVFAIQEVNSDM